MRDRARDEDNAAVGPAIHAGTGSRSALEDRRVASGSLPSAAPGPASATAACPDERILATRRQVLIDRRHPPGATPMLSGDLFVTPDRVVHAGWIVVDVPLRQIEDAVVVCGSLMLLLDAGRCVTIRTADPHGLRRVIAVARADLRGGGSTPSPRPRGLPYASSR